MTSERTRYGDTQHKLANAENAFTASRKEVVSLRQKATSLDSELASTKSELASTKSELASTIQALRVARQEKCNVEETLTAQVEEARGHCAALEGNKKKLKKKLVLAKECVEKTEVSCMFLRGKAKEYKEVVISRTLFMFIMLSTPQCGSVYRVLAQLRAGVNSRLEQELSERDEKFKTLEKVRASVSSMPFSYSYVALGTSSSRCAAHGRSRCSSCGDRAS